MFSVVVPLYAVAVGLNAAEVGLIVAARSVLPTLLSIHGGILADQLGTRRVLKWVACACTLLPLLYPVSGWFVALLLLQLIMGLASSFGMATSQTWAMLVSRGSTAMLARYSIATRVGTFIGPVVVGVAWDILGPWAAFSCIALCGAGVIWATASVPAQNAPPLPYGQGLSVLLPRWAPHKQALLLATVPAVAFILGASLLRNSSGAIQSSMFVVYLNGTGMSGTLIGALVAIAELSGVAGSLLTAPAEKRLGSAPLVIACIVVSIVCMSATPLLSGFLVLLVIACVLRGVVQGMSQPLMYAILSHEVGSHQQGASVGLRNAFVRLGSIVTPTAMGVAAELYGIEMSFYVVGSIMMLATVGLALYGRKLSRRE
jgi:MFS family permease